LISPESHNYYHWLSDVLPRIRLYEPVFDQVDHFCVASNVPAKFLLLLNEFGIPEEKILKVAEKGKLHFDHLFVSSLPGSEGRSPNWAVDYLREKLIRSTSSWPSKKIYFKRGGNIERKILNEDSLLAQLQNEGFEIIDPGALTVRQQIELVSCASIIISAHGAAFSNLLFCPDRTAVIEIFSPDYFRTDCYYTLSAIRRLDYWYIIGDKPADAKWGDVTVDQLLLKKTIAALQQPQ
jgi:capsular polysaccharide biosynthesis protein